MAAGEFEPHANCWMGWPDSGYLWRDNAKPAQKQYADIAKAISQFEPVVMMANPEVTSYFTSLFAVCADICMMCAPGRASACAAVFVPLCIRLVGLQLLI